MEDAIETVDLFVIYTGLFALAVTGVLVAIGLAMALRDQARRLSRLEEEWRAWRGGVPAPPPAVREHVSPIAPATATAPATIPPPVVAPVRVPSTPSRSVGLEQTIGGVWLQHVGSGLVLLGVLLFLIWGYVSRELSPMVLVLVGILAGIAFAWRGDRVARHLPPFGHALIGTGIGIAYISIYLGHFLLRALTPEVTFPLLALTSFVALAAGRHYGVQTIAALGVLGAYLPELLGVWIPLHGFRLTPLELLGHLALVNAVVFLLAASASWSGVALMSLWMAAVTWMVNVPHGGYGWPVQIGLSALFALLGVSALPRLARPGAVLRGLDLAVAATAPLLLLLCSLSFFERVRRSDSGLLLLALAAFYVLTAAWIARRRGTNDVWRPITAAATVFLAGAFERFLGAGARTAWAAEAFALTAIGIGVRSTWLRLCGYVLGFATFLWSLGVLTFSSEDGLWWIDAGSLRTLAFIGLGLAAARLLAREREALRPAERHASEVWSALANALLMLWAAHEVTVWSNRLVSLPRWEHVVGTTLTALAWTLQSAALLVIGRRVEDRFLRILGYIVGAHAALLMIAAVGMAPSYTANAGGPHLTAAVAASLCGTIFGALAYAMSRRRDHLSHVERNAPEIMTIGANLVFLAWIHMQADTLARWLGARGGPTGFFTSLGWLGQAIAVFSVGWWHGSAFLRWVGLFVFGLTIGKFLLFDLRSESPFWRFLIAILAGAVFLVISYLYQRRSTRPSTAP